MAYDSQAEGVALFAPLSMMATRGSIPYNQCGALTSEAQPW